jgi:hypothetical protein
MLRERDPIGYGKVPGGVILPGPPSAKSSRRGGQCFS